MTGRDSCISPRIHRASSRSNAPVPGNRLGATSGGPWGEALKFIVNKGVDYGFRVDFDIGLRYRKGMWMLVGLGEKGDS